MTKHIKIAIFGDGGSAQVEAFRSVLEKKGVEAIAFDIQLGGPGQPSVIMDSQRLIWQGVDFSDIDAIHVRCMSVNTPLAVPALMNEASYNEMRNVFLREQEFQSISRSFFSQLGARGKLVINQLTHAYIDHDTKAQLYQKLHAEGFCVPDTIMTNSANLAKSFFIEIGDSVAKPSIGIGSTRKVNEHDQERLEELRASPVLFQDLIEGDTIRVHIVGDKVILALRIVSEEGQVDSRTNPQGFEYFKLPEKEEKHLVACNRFLGLHFSAWDILAAKDGRFAYLDCNPGPFILWIGKRNTDAVFNCLADYMIAFVKTQSIELANEAVTPCTQSYDD